MDYETTYENSVWEFLGNVNFRHIVAALKLFKADHVSRDDKDPVYRTLCGKYMHWFLSDRNRLEKDIAMMLLLEESILETEIMDILMPHEKITRMADSEKSLNVLWELIRSQEEKKQSAPQYEERDG